MKGTLLRVFGAMIVIALILLVVLADRYTQMIKAEDARIKVEEWKMEKFAAVEADKGKLIREEKLKVLQRRMIIEEEMKRQLQTYTLQTAGKNNNIFVNKVDGYRICIPKEMQVDMHFSNVRAVLECETLTIEIYRQDIENTTGSGIESYINYSNLFMDNRIDHKKELEEKCFINGRAISLPSMVTKCFKKN